MKTNKTSTNHLLDAVSSSLSPGVRPTPPPPPSGTELTGSAAATMLLAVFQDVLGPLQTRRDRAQAAACSPVSPAVGQLMTGYGPRRGYEPAQGFHTGLDFYSPRGTPVFAVQAGRVEMVVHDEVPKDGFIGYGNAVVIYHREEDLWSFYAHLDESLVLPDMEVERGQVLGYVGNTTNGRLPGMIVRLHFELRRRTITGESPFPGPYRVNTIDPEPWLKRHGVRFDEEGNIIEERPPANAIERPAFVVIEPRPEREIFERLTPRPEMVWDTDDLK